MPDYIVMSELTIEHFHTENPAMRIIITLREPVARMYSYFSMQATAAGNHLREGSIGQYPRARRDGGDALRCRSPRIHVCR
jgi:hypothetical protein